MARAARTSIWDAPIDTHPQPMERLFCYPDRLLRLTFHDGRKIPSHLRWVISDLTCA